MRDKKLQHKFPERRGQLKIWRLLVKFKSPSERHSTHPHAMRNAGRRTGRKVLIHNALQPE
jgi:hypothetical protein